MLAFFAIVFGVIYIDQLSKWLTVIFLKGEDSFYLINNVLRFSYVENRGAAFGMLADSRWVFLVISGVMIVVITVYMFKYRPKNKWAYVSCAFIVGGGIGNMIDRIFLGYVIDFIDFCAFPKIWHYVFNVADSFVCVGAGILMVYLVISTFKEAKEEKRLASIAAEESAESTDQSNETAESEDSDGE